MTEYVQVPKHYAENIGYAAAMLENSASVIDRHNAPALRELLKCFAATPEAQVAPQGGGETRHKFAHDEDNPGYYCCQTCGAVTTDPTTQPAGTLTHSFVDCVFHGPPPAPFEAWNKWAAGPVLEGVTIRATKPTYVTDCKVTPGPLERGFTVGTLSGDVEQVARAVPYNYRAIAHLIGSIYFAGDFKAETPNERTLESLLREVGTRYESWDQVEAGYAQLDAPIRTQALDPLGAVDELRKALADIRSWEYRRGDIIHQRDRGDRCMCAACIESRADAALSAKETANGG